MKQTKKKPINVQLSKQDLMELFTGVKDFIQEELRTNVREQVLAELSRHSQRVYLNSSENAKRIAEIEAREEKNGVTISKKIGCLEYQMRCGAETGHNFTIQSIYQYDIIICCTRCALECRKSKSNLNRKEKKLLRIVSKGRK